MIIVTGGAGMVGSNIVHGLNAIGRDDIIVVDDLTDGRKFRNLAGAKIADYLHIEELRAAIEAGRLEPCEVVFHQGACSSTTEWDGKFMLSMNFTYSKMLFHWTTSHDIPLVYASSAAVYGRSDKFEEAEACEGPLNVYGYSKKLFDDYVRRNHLPQMSPVVGLRYFNVYGPREEHKGAMASVAFHLYNQNQRGESLKLFGAFAGVPAGQQARDFIYVEDVVSVNLWAWRSGASGIFNCGTGRAQPFLDVGSAIIAECGSGEIEFIDFPEHLKGCYQDFTQADITRLRSAGYNAPFRSVEDGVKDYVGYLNGTAM